MIVLYTHGLSLLLLMSLNFLLYETVQFSFDPVQNISCIRTDCSSPCQFRLHFSIRKKPRKWANSSWTWMNSVLYLWERGTLIFVGSILSQFLLMGLATVDSIPDPICHSDLKSEPRPNIYRLGNWEMHCLKTQGLDSSGNVIWSS